MKNVVPYQGVQVGKKEQVTQMFNNIAVKYDALNTFFTLGIDNHWRRMVIKELEEFKPKNILDIATGTCELAMRMTSLEPKEITGVDISNEMLLEGQKKIRKKGLDHIIKLKLGDGEQLPVPDNHYDAATIAFGIRNFEHPEKGLKEVLKALKPGGACVILELSKPENFPVKQFHNFYSNRIMPFCAKVVSNDVNAYRYLPKSVSAFIYGREMLQLLEKVGFVKTRLRAMTYGIASIYIGIKPK